MSAPRRFLVLQFRESPRERAAEQRGLCRAAGSVSLDFYTAADPALSLTSPVPLLAPYAGLILGGSGDFDFDGGRAAEDPVRRRSLALLEELRALFAYVLAHDVPTFGICFGHQLLGAFAGEPVAYDAKQCKTGSYELTLTAAARTHPLCAGVAGSSLIAHYRHHDVLRGVPPSARLLASAPNCQVAALCYSDRIISTQFHPELTYSDMLERARTTPGYLPPGVAPDTQFVPDDTSGVLLRNFFAAASGDDAGREGLDA